MKTLPFCLFISNCLFLHSFLFGFRFTFFVFWPISFFVLGFHLRDQTYHTYYRAQIWEGLRNVEMLSANLFVHFEHFFLFSCMIILLPKLRKVAKFEFQFKVLQNIKEDFGRIRFYIVYNMKFWYCNYVYLIIKLYRTKDQYS